MGPETLATVVPRALRLPPPLALQLARELPPPLPLTRHLTVVPMKYLSIGILRTRPRKVSVVPPGEVGSAAAVQPAEEPEAVDPGGAVGAVHKDDAAAVVLAKYTKVADGADGTNNYTAPAKLAGAAANLAAAAANHTAAANLAAARRTLEPYANLHVKSPLASVPGCVPADATNLPLVLAAASSAGNTAEAARAVHLAVHSLVFSVVFHLASARFSP